MRGDTWPPPPVKTYERRPYDKYLFNTLRTAVECRRPISRLHLVQTLHETHSIGLREAKQAVDRYCDRHQILPSPKGIGPRIGCLLALIQIISATAFAIFQIHVSAVLNSRHSHAEHLMLGRQMLFADLTLFPLMILVPVLMLTYSVRTRKNVWREVSDFIETNAPTNKNDAAGNKPL